MTELPGSAHAATAHAATAQAADAVGRRPPVALEVADGVATIRFDRPEAMNALDLATKTALLGSLREVADDPAVRVVVVTGSGRAFCVGQDLREHAEGLQRGDESLAATVADHYNPAVLAIATMPKPVVAALNGVAAGAGVSLALAADFRIMVAGAGMNLAFTAIALSCDTGASWTLPRLVGVAKAKELLLLPSTLEAADCLRLGLVTRVVEPADFDSAVAELAHQLALGPTLAYAAVREAIHFSATHGLEESLANEGRLMGLTGRSADHRAAVEAFLAKRPAAFQGR